MGPQGDKVSEGSRERPHAVPAGFPPEMITAVLALLPPNEVALSARRTCRAAAQHFADEHHRTAAIGQALPPHAASGTLAAEAEAAFRSLSFRQKLRSLYAAAASGSVTNLEVTWRLLQPCVFPELWTTDFYRERLRQGTRRFRCDAGALAVRAGNIPALSWLLDRCPGLVDCSRTLVAAAEHCLLPQLQEAWGLLSAVDSSLRLDDAVLDAAAESPTPDATAKMQWTLQQGDCALTLDTAAAATRSGDLARLRWLQERGCPFDSREVLEAALANADLSVAEWLVDEAGCPLPGPGPQDAAARVAVEDVVCAAASSGKAAKLRWLQARGVELLPALTDQPWAMRAAAESGSLEVVQFLHHLGGDRVLSAGVMAAAVKSGSLDVASYLLKAGCPVDREARIAVGLVGDVAMARWLAEAGQLPMGDVRDDVLRMWPEWRAAQRRQLLEVVRLVAPPGGSADERMQRCAMHHAASRGDVGLMRYLHEELGAELGPEVLVDAADGGCEAAIEWLVERGCGAGAVEQLDGCYVNAAANGDLAALACLRRLGVPWSEGLLVKAVRQREVPLPVVQWLWGQGARVGRQELEHARRGLLDEEYERRAPMSDEKRQAVEWLRAQLALHEWDG